MSLKSDEPSFCLHRGHVRCACHQVLMHSLQYLCPQLCLVLVISYLQPSVKDLPCQNADLNCILADDTIGFRFVLVLSPQIGQVSVLGL